ncbi:MAG: hypothetical protein NC131_00370 [Roseburia sp.]|nr:hypothetical protein [Roseburia sp.]
MAKVKAAKGSKGGKFSKAVDNIKGKVGNAAQSIKIKVSDYNQAIRKAYGLGYSTGWDDCENIPPVVGARMAATVGYGHGIKARKRYNKAQKKLSYQNQNKR